MDVRYDYHLTVSCRLDHGGDVASCVLGCESPFGHLGLGDHVGCGRVMARIGS